VSRADFLSLRDAECNFDIRSANGSGRKRRKYRRGYISTSQLGGAFSGVVSNTLTSAALARAWCQVTQKTASEAVRRQQNNMGRVHRALFICTPRRRKE
jgi:hypothetical protein